MPPKDDNLPRGYLDGKDKDDCDRYVREVVQNYIDNRTFDQRDEQMIKDAVGESIDLRLSNHAAQCAQQRSKGSHSNLTIIISIISMLVSLAGLIIILYKMSGLQNLPNP